MQFKSRDCKFFGHRLTPQGIKPDKVQPVLDMKPLQSVSVLQSFNGMVNYLKQFSPVLTQLSEPLRRLCKQGVVWAWESEQQTALGDIKKIITTLPVLAHSDNTKEHIIQSDASKIGFGAVLIQESRPVVYTSSALTDIKHRYFNIEREFLSVVSALKRLHHYTYRHTITVETDHEPLTSIC